MISENAERKPDEYVSGDEIDQMIDYTLDQLDKEEECKSVQKYKSKRVRDPCTLAPLYFFTSEKKARWADA